MFVYNDSSNSALTYRTNLYFVCKRHVYARLMEQQQAFEQAWKANATEKNVFRCESSFSNKDMRRKERACLLRGITMHPIKF